MIISYSIYKTIGEQLPLNCTLKNLEIFEELKNAIEKLYLHDILTDTELTKAIKNLIRLFKKI